MVIGKTGTGISFTANAILKDTLFNSKASKRSVTTALQRGESNQDGQKMIVIDTPGMFNTSLSTIEIKTHLRESIKWVHPGPNAFIYIFPLRGHTAEDQLTIKEMVDVFSNEMFKAIIVVFTDREISNVLSNCPLEEYLKDMPDYVIRLIERCENRCLALSFDGHANENNLNKLFFLLNNMQIRRVCYTQNLILQPRMNLRRRIERIKYDFDINIISKIKRMQLSIARFIKPGIMLLLIGLFFMYFNKYQI